MKQDKTYSFGKKLGHRKDSSKDINTSHPREGSLTANNSKKLTIAPNGLETKKWKEVTFVYPRKEQEHASNNTVRDKFLFRKRVQKRPREETEDTPSEASNDHKQGHKSPKTSGETLHDILFSSKNTTPKSLRSEKTQNTNNTRAPKLSGISVQEAVRDKSGCRPRANSTDFELNLPRRGLCDEGMVLKSHNWLPTWQGKRPKGFVNLGNTCFLNATLQCLAYLPPFCQALTGLRPQNGKVSQGRKITHLLAKLFRDAHGIGPSTNQRDAIAPRAVVNAVPTLGTIGSRNGYRFRPGRQEDAHEFLIHLLDAMHDGELKLAGINQQSRGWRERLPIPRLDETTFINRIFGGYLRSQVRCTKCGYCSNTYDPILDLSLEVSKKSSTSISTAFQEFTRPERLDINNRWKCSGCTKNVRAVKQLTVFRPPLSLLVQLKRFSYSAFGGFNAGMKYIGSGGGSKIGKAIQFPERLLLPLSDGRKCEYGLTGVVVHLGGSATSGHYTAYVKRPGPSDSSTWFHMDDSFVERVSAKTVLKQKDAYVLLYCRKEVALELPSPPLIPPMPPTPPMETVESERESTVVHDQSPTIAAKKARVQDPISENKQTSSVVEKDMAGHKSKIPEVRKPLVNDGGGDTSASIDQPITPAKKTEPKKTRVVLNRGPGQGKLEMIIGPRYKPKVWKPKTSIARSVDSKLELLGSVGVSKWDDDDSTGLQSRSVAVKQIRKQEGDRQKSMRLDRWDAALDIGKQKKVKTKVANSMSSDSSAQSKAFQRIQCSLQSMHRGRAKGMHHSSGKVKTPVSAKKNSKFIKRHR